MAQTAAPLSKVIRHPDKEEIIRRLLAGESTREIETYLKEKYHKPTEKRYHISYMTLQKFRSEELNIKRDVLNDIKNRRNNDELVAFDHQVRAVVQNSSAYQDKLNEIVGNEMDMSRRLLEMEKLIASRMEFYYNQLVSGTFDKDGETIFISYLNSMRSVMQDYKKYIEGFADKKIDHNINISVVDDQLKIMKEVVVDVLRDMDPNLVLVFMEKINTKMVSLKHGTPEYDKYLQVIDVQSDVDH